MTSTATTISSALNKTLTPTSKWPKSTAASSRPTVPPSTMPMSKAPPSQPSPTSSAPSTAPASSSAQPSNGFNASSKPKPTRLPSSAPPGKPWALPMSHSTHYLKRFAPAQPLNTPPPSTNSLRFSAGPMTVAPLSCCPRSTPKTPTSPAS